jgi:hypothetical protein
MEGASVLLRETWFVVPTGLRPYQCDSLREAEKILVDFPESDVYHEVTMSQRVPVKDGRIG